MLAQEAAIIPGCSVFSESVNHEKLLYSKAHVANKIH